MLLNISYCIILTNEILYYNKQNITLNERQKKILRGDFTSFKRTYSSSL